MKAFLGIILATLLLLGGVVWVYVQGKGGASDDIKSLTVYCAAGIKKPVSAIAKRYQEEYGVEVQLQYGGTQTLLEQIRLAKRGDLFIAADNRTILKARELGLAEEVIPLCEQYPVIAVRKGNPKGVTSLEDLFREDLKVALANPEAASIGEATKSAVGDRWEELTKKVAVMKLTVTELAADLQLGTVDAAVLWNSTVPQYKDIEAVKVKELFGGGEVVQVTVLNSTERPAAALKFARYMAAPEKGGATFEDQEFYTVGGDRWAERPEMILYSGGVNRPAVEKTLREFSEREGVTVTTVFNGCGILCAEMKAMEGSSNPRYPDAYYACDLCFVPPVAEVFPESVMLTETEIGIAVRKGNPKGIKSLADLAGDALKVGICNAKQSTLGYMTDGMLKSSALDTAIRKNVVVEVPTADFLVNQMRAGALDAAIVYKVNYQLQEEHLEFIKIDHEGARAVQPYSVRGNSENRQLAWRLLEYLRKNRDRFEESGFTWRGDEPPMKSADIEIPPWLKGPAE